MFRSLQKLILTVFFTAFAAQASAMFVQPDWLDVTNPNVGTNRYSYSGNDPVNNIDPSGNEMQPLLNGDLRRMVYQNNGRRMMSNGRLSQMTGTVFEGAVLRSMGLISNTEPAPSDLRGQLTNGLKNYVLPDAVGFTKVMEPRTILGRSVTFLGPKTDVGLLFVEAKTTSGSRPLSRSYDQYQLAGFIDVLSEFKTSNGIGVLEMVTTAETEIGGSLIELATKRGVALYHRTASYDPETGKFVVGSGTLLNPSVLRERQKVEPRDPTEVDLFND